MAGNIFINYRREESSHVAGRLHDSLAPTFGGHKLFMDVDNIPVGRDFEEYLKSQVTACDAMLAIIGPNWLTAKDETGQRRLDNPADFVAIEIGAALARSIPVVPVLVDGARMPKASELPDSLKPLARRQAIEVRHTNFNSDAEALVKRLREALGYNSPEGRWRVRVAIGVTALVVLLLIGLGSYGYLRHAVEQRVQQAELKRQEDRMAAMAEANRKVEEAERQRLAEEERKARAVREAEEKRKAQEVEKKGMAASNSGDLDGAIANFNEALRLDPKNAVVFFNRGWAYSRKRDDDRAFADYSESIRLDPKNSGAFNNRGLIYSNKREYDKAIADFNEAVQSNPYNFQAFNNRGLAYSNKRDYDKAIADYNEAIRLNPNYVVALNNRGLAHDANRDYDKAIADYDKAIQLDPYNARAFNDRGWVYSKMEDYDKAIADYSESIRLDPQNAARPFYNRAFAYSKIDDHDNAIADYSEVLRLNPNSALALCNRGRAKLKIQQTSGNEDVAKARQIDPYACR